MTVKAPALEARERLVSEARLLVDLLAVHLDDRQRAKDRHKQLIYFIDAHELKAYLHANKADYLGGFVLDAERSQFNEPDLDALQSRIRLISEQMLQWLLFDYPGQVVLLPSHGEELDEEIAYQARLLLATQLGLIADARRQVEAIRKKTLSSGLLATYAEKAESGDAQSKQTLIKFLGESAPALTALLRLTPDTIEKRIQHLADHGNLVLLRDVDWSEFGFDPTVCDRIEALGLDHALAEKWRALLASRRGNSYRANRLDAEAIAFLCSFNAVMKECRHESRAVLVTRAMTLISLLRAGKDQSGFRADAAGVVRHSRLLVVTGDKLVLEDAAHPSTSEDPVSAGLQQLGVALTAYERQLNLLPHDRHELPREEARSLINAWNSFEAARFTMDFAASGISEPDAAQRSRPDEGFTQLLRWLKSEDDVEALVVERLNSRVLSFGHETFTRNLQSSIDLSARISLVKAKRRVRVQPLAGPGTGPVEFDVALFGHLTNELSSQKASMIFDVMKLVQRGNASDVAEDYLAWSLLQSCLGNWNLAEIYAESAVLSARILHRRSTEVEAQLLLAQILRLEGPKHHEHRRMSHEEVRRFERARRTLNDAGKESIDPRLLVESAALTIERLLWFDETPEVTRKAFESGVEFLNQARNLLPDATGMRARVAELALVFALATHERFKLPQYSARTLFEIVLVWHAELVETLTAMRQNEEFEADEISRQSRAIEFIGYDLLRDLAAQTGNTITAKMVAPSSIRFEVDVLQSLLAGQFDKTAQLVAKILARTIARTPNSREFNLVYAPVWDVVDDEALWASDIPDKASREAASKASKIVHDIGERQSILQGNGTIQDVERLQTASSLFEGAIAEGHDASPRAMFRLHMEHCYAELLRSHVEKEPEKTACLVALVGRYDALVEQYPDSSVLHYRRSIALSGLDRNDEAIESIMRALEMLDRDRYIGKDHWIRSTIVRRVAFFFGAEARGVRAQLQLDPSNDSLRATYLATIKRAFGVVHPDFEERRAGAPYFAKLEMRRRLNNIVYYAALYLESGGVPSGLAQDFDQDRLIDYTRRLHADGMEEVAEWNIIHTIGYVYNVLEHRAEASRAADRLLNVISRSGANAESESIRHAINDALLWKQRAEDTSPSPLR